MRIKITDAEAAQVGITPSTPCEDYVDGGEKKLGWGKLVLQLLKDRGVPEEYLVPGDMRCVPIARHPDESNIYTDMNPEVPGVVFVVQGVV